MTDVSKFKHWYLLAYQVQVPGAWVPHSIIVASDKVELNVPQLNMLKKAHQVPDGAVLVGISYMGWQTEKSINGQPEIDPPTKLSDAYRVGMVSAARVRPSDEQQPINPYSGLTPEDMAKADEWASGFAAMRAMQIDVTTPVPCTAPPPLPAPEMVGERAEPVQKPLPGKSVRK